MKAIIEFDLPNEEHQHKYAINGRKLYDIINEFDSFMKGQIDRAEMLSDEQYELLVSLNEQFNNAIRRKLNVKYIKEW
jgi:hypothetical protein